jgi:hypothetical protein
MIRLGSLLCLLAALACSGCDGSQLLAGCRIGGLDSNGNPCTPATQAVGAKSRQPVESLGMR